MKKYSMNFMNVYKVAIDAIKNYDKDDVKFWAKLEWHRIAKAMGDNISANVLIQIFPRNPDSPMDDVKITTPIDSSSTKLITANYLKAFRSVASSMRECDHIYNHRFLLQPVPKKTGIVATVKQFLKRILSPAQEMD